MYEVRDCILKELAVSHYYQIQCENKVVKDLNQFWLIDDEDEPEASNVLKLPSPHYLLAKRNKHTGLTFKEKNLL